MRIKPNLSVVEGRVEQVRPAADGWGAEVVVTISKCKPAKGFEDFIQATPDTEMTFFSAEPEQLVAGQNYRLQARMMGGPDGERAVLQEYLALPN